MAAYIEIKQNSPDKVCTVNVETHGQPSEFMRRPDISGDSSNTSGLDEMEDPQARTNGPDDDYSDHFSSDDESYGMFFRPTAPDGSKIKSARELRFRAKYAPLGIPGKLKQGENYDWKRGRYIAVDVYLAAKKAKEEERRREIAEAVARALEERERKEREAKEKEEKKREKAKEKKRRSKERKRASSSEAQSPEKEEGSSKDSSFDALKVDDKDTVVEMEEECNALENDMTTDDMFEPSSNTGSRAVAEKENLPSTPSRRCSLVHLQEKEERIKQKVEEQQVELIKAKREVSKIELLRSCAEKHEKSKALEAELTVVKTIIQNSPAGFRRGSVSSLMAPVAEENEFSDEEDRMPLPTTHGAVGVNVVASSPAKQPRLIYTKPTPMKSPSLPAQTSTPEEPCLSVSSGPVVTFKPSMETPPANSSPTQAAFKTPTRSALKTPKTPRSASRLHGVGASPVLNRSARKDLNMDLIEEDAPYGRDVPQPLPFGGGSAKSSAIPQPLTPVSKRRSNNVAVVVTPKSSRSGRLVELAKGSPSSRGKSDGGFRPLPTTPGRSHSPVGVRKLPITPGRSKSPVGVRELPSTPGRSKSPVPLARNIFKPGSKTPTTSPMSFRSKSSFRNAR